MVRTLEPKSPSQPGQDSEKLLRIVTGSARVGLVVVNQKYEYLFANEAYSEVFGLPPGAIVGRRVPDVLAPVWSQIKPRLDRALAGERVVFELTVPPSAGTDQPRHFSVRYQPHQDGDGKPQVIAVVADITERRRMEVALRESEQRYRTLFQSIDEGFCVVEVIFDKNEKPVDYVFLEVNAAFQRQTGIADAVGKSVQSLVPDQEQYWFEAYGKVALTGRPVRFENRARGLNRWYDVFAFRLEPPEKRRVAIIFHDITERRQTADAVSHLAAIVRFSDDAIISKDLNGIITSWNGGAERLFGYTAAEAVGKSVTMLIPSDRISEEATILDRVRRRQPIEHYETIRRRKDGTLLNVSLTVSPITDSAGTIVGASKIARDVTVRKQAEDALARRASQQAALYEFTDRLYRAGPETEVCEPALEAVLSALQCPRASVLFFDEAGVMQFVASRGLSETYRREVTGHSPWKPDTKDPTPIWINDINASDQPEAIKDVIKREGIRALAFFPLLVGGKIIGKFMAYYDTPHTFVPEELSLGLIIARQLGLAIERKQADRALRESEERARQQFAELSAIYQSAPLGLAVLDTKLRYRRVNERLAEINGAPSAQHIGKTLQEMVPALTKQAENILREVLEKGAPVRLEFHGETPAQPGVERVWDETWYPLPDEQGKITGVGLVVEEITERKRSEKGLRLIAEAAAYRNRLSDALRPVLEPMQIQAEAAHVLGEHFKASRVHYAEVDADEQYAVVARDFVRGVPSRVGRHLLSNFESLIRECRAGQTFISGDLAVDPRLSATERTMLAALPVSAMAVVPLVKHDRLVGLLSVHYAQPHQWTPDEIALVEETADRTWAAVERARDQQALRESEERFRTLVEQVKDYAIFRMDTKGRPISWNEGVQRVFGFAEEEFIGKVIIPLIFTPEDLASGVADNELRTAAETGTASNDRWLLKKDRSRFYASGVTTGLRNDAGEHIGYVKVLRDETTSKQAQDALAEARIKLREHAANLEQTVATRTQDLRTANEQLEAFVYSIAHDLRAPLRSMGGFAQLLVEDYAPKLDDTAQHLLKRIQNSSEFMDKLLLDLLAYGRTARSDVESTAVPLRKAWDSAVFQCSPQIEQAGAEIETIEPLLTVCAHEATLGQCFANLLSNALKFIAPGKKPHIRFRAEERDNYIRAWVEDNGIGIPPEQRDRIFRVFERLHGARFQGTGIGLSIVKKGIERMGGRVGVESELGKGSRFWVELPKPG